MTSRDPDKFIKSLSIFEDKVYYMENLNDISENQEMIKNNLEGKLSIEKIDTELIEIILPKSFRGVPLFTLEMVDSLVVIIILILRIVINMFSIQDKNFLQLRSYWICIQIGIGRILLFQ